MKLNKMDGALYKAMVIGGAENLKKYYADIDKLNVFPVPDGDTGTNMKMPAIGVHSQNVMGLSSAVR